MTSYTEIVDNWGYDVIDRKLFGLWQGDIWYVLRYGERYGYVLIGYGSCTGCDALENIDYFYTDDEARAGAINELSDQLQQNIRWFDSKQDFIANVLEAGDEGNDWYWFDTEIKEYTKAFVENWANEYSI